MARTKSKKQKLLISFLCMLLSISMLVSSTFAWFTDTVKNNGNIIQSGNLDIEMYWTDDPATGTWHNVEEDAYNTIFSYENWEPGYTDVKYIKIVNKGNLALNYDLTIAPQGAVGKLAEVINVYFAINDDKLNLRSDLDQLSCIGLLNNVMNGGSTASGTLLPEGTTSLFHESGEVIVTLAMQMITSAGNEYQNETSGDFTIKALATQAPWESDSFGADYDSQAEMPIALVATNITVPVTPDAEGKVPTGGLEIVGANAAAYLPAGVKLADGATEATLRITPNTASQSGLSVVNDEMLIPFDVHIDGVAQDNDVPIIIDLGVVMPKYLNLGNYYIVHVEDGVNEVMTQVSSRDDLAAHNQFTYNSDTGAVSVSMANFSAVEVITNNANVWKGGVDYKWFYNWTYRDDDNKRRTYTLTNADQLYGFARILGKMLSQDEWNVIPELRDDLQTDNDVYVDANGKNILDMGFNGHTIQLLNDVNLGGGNVVRDGKKVMFYPIGYYNSTRDTNSPTAIIYDRTDGKVEDLTITSDFEAFRGTFNGNGHTISNLYQNTWDMFGDYNDGYSGHPNYYKDGMGLFGWLYGATIYNTNVDKFESDGEFTPTGVIAAYAEAAHDPDSDDYGATTIQGVSITNSNPRVYNTGNGGIVGIGGRSTNTKDCSTCKLMFSNITVDQSNKISALWGSWDVACGGIMGMFRGYGKVEFTNCHVAAQIDVYNDVCGNYQYYWYRYAGMIIGSLRGRNTTDAQGYTVPDMQGISASNCTVRFDEWNDYYYCELVDNSLASYTHDHQMSRLEEVRSVEGTTITNLDGTTKQVPASGRANYVVVEPGERSTEKAKCFHFKDGQVWTHEMGGIDQGIDENKDGQDDLKEDKQHIYLPFNQLFQGDGWGVKHIPIYDDGTGFPGVTIMKVEDFSKQKFEAKFTTSASAPMKVAAGATLTVGDLFTAIGEVDAASVGIYVEKILNDGTYERVIVDNKVNWANRVFTLEEGVNAVYQISIQDFKYCLPTVMYLEAVTQTKEATCEHCQKSVTWKPWYPGALPTGHYYLVDHITSSAPITVKAGADVVLDLAGKTMNFPQSAAVDVGEGRSFSIVDSDPDGYGTINGFGDEYGLLKVSGGNLNLYDGNYSYGLMLAEDDEAQISTKGIIWAANPENATSETKTNVLFTDKVAIPAEARIFLAADAQMTLKGNINGQKIPLVELETNALLNIQNMTGDAGKPIEIMANGEFAYITGAEQGQTDKLNQAKTWFKAADGYTAITIQAKSLFTQIDLTEAIKAGFQRGQTVAAATANMRQLIENKTCPMCGKTNVTWVKYNSASHALVQGGSQLHLYLDSTNCGSKDDPIKGGNFIGSYKGDTDICVMLMDGAKVYTNGRFLVNPDNTLNIMGNGSVHSYGTSGLGLFTILGKNTNVNIYGGTFTYEGSYSKNDPDAEPQFALIYTSSKHSVVNIYNDATIGYTAAEIGNLSPEKKANYNVNMSGTLNMYGGIIRNGISANEWLSGNVTVQRSGVLNMYDGEITGGQTNYRGGNVLLHSLATMNMGYRDTIDGVNMTPVVSDGTALYSKNVYDAADAAAQAKLDEKKANGEVAEDATITAVDRIPGGGNIGTKGFVGYMTFNMYTGTITNGKTIPGNDDYSVKDYMRFYMGGGNLYLSGAYSNNALVAGRISDGEAYSGGNIYIRNGVKLTLKSTARVENGKAIVTNGDIGGHGGNINVFHGAIMTMEGGVVTGGQARIGGNINIGETAGENPYVKILAGEVSNGTATESGGNIHIAGLSQLDITGGTFSGCTAANGGNIYATGTDKTDDNKNVIGTNKPVVNISGGTFSDSSATAYGGNFLVSNGTMNITGGTIDGATANNGGNIWVTTSAELRVSGGIVTGGIAKSSGGNIAVTNNAQVTVSGTATITKGRAITDNKDSGQGGNINVGNGAVLTVEGGTISEGYSRLGGNIAVGQSTGSNATVYIKGGVVRDGAAKTNGGNILCAYLSALNISGGQIFGGQLDANAEGFVNYGLNLYVGLINTDKDGNPRKPSLTISGGTITGAIEIAQSKVTVNGVETPLCANVKLSGSPIIEGDPNARYKWGLKLANNARIDISELQSSAQINIDQYTPYGEFTLSSNNADSVKDCFKPFNDDYVIGVANNVLQLVKIVEPIS